MTDGEICDVSMYAAAHLMHRWCWGREDINLICPIEQYTEEQGIRESQSLYSLQLENEALVTRLASLQEDKWRLEERVVMLEQSGAEMAEELVIKSRLIQTHVIETGAKRERRGSGAAGAVR